MTRLRFPALPDLDEELFRLIAQVPRDAITTFGDLARALGDRAAALWVARTLATHPHTRGCHCHRVVRKTGEPLDPATSIPRLIADGIPFEENAKTPRVCLENRFAGFRSTQPLARLGRWLDRAAERVSETSLTEMPRLVAGLDVAYRSPHIATIAAVVVDVAAKTVIWSAAAECPAAFPYIPGYLTFRELPALLEGRRLIQKSGFKPQVFFIDGLGRLHPRRAGVACGFAVVTGLPTVGVAKSLLCGKVESQTASPRPVTHQGDLLGYEIHGPGIAQPVYVSVGGGIGLEQSVDLTARLFAGRRLPIPTDEADRLSKKAKRRT
jgi:deoxyribonuclease V